MGKYISTEDGIVEDHHNWRKVEPVLREWWLRHPNANNELELMGVLDQIFGDAPDTDTGGPGGWQEARAVLEALINEHQLLVETDDAEPGVMCVPALHIQAALDEVERLRGETPCEVCYRDLEVAEKRIEELEAVLREKLEPALRAIRRIELEGGVRDHRVVPKTTGDE